MTYGLWLHDMERLVHLPLRINLKCVWPPKYLRSIANISSRSYCSCPCEESSGVCYRQCSMPVVCQIAVGRFGPRPGWQSFDVWHACQGSKTRRSEEQAGTRKRGLSTRNNETNTPTHPQRLGAKKLKTST